MEPEVATQINRMDEKLFASYCSYDARTYKGKPLNTDERREKYLRERNRIAAKHDVPERTLESYRIDAHELQLDFAGVPARRRI